MSQKTVEWLIGRLVTDEEWRRSFTAQPREALYLVREQGFDLTEGEIAALAATDPRIWAITGRRVHPELKRCSLKSP